MNKETAASILCLEEEKSKKLIKLAIGKWGVAWLLDILIEIFEDIADNPGAECCHVVNATTRVLIFQGLKNLFDNKKPAPPMQ